MPSTGESEGSDTPSPSIPSPYVSPTETLAEATLKATLAGIVFGILFGAANAYLGLRAGLIISTSIPVAVMSVAFFRALRAGGVESSILEANLSQTVGSASSSVASGVIFTLPALFLWGFDTTLVQITLLAMSGGLLGVLFMIPLRSYLIVREHPNLPYPEGTACAEVLKASQGGAGRARNVFVGLGVGAVLKGLTGWLRAVPDELQVSIPFLNKGQLGSAVSPALLGVGYILGLRVATIMVGGGLLSWLAIIPIIAWWGEGRLEPLYPETVLTITEMSPSLIWTRYVRYIGAGAVATGGLITLVRSVPTMVESFQIGSRQLLRERAESRGEAGKILRTDRDLSLSTVGIGACIVFGVLAFVPLAFSSIEIPAGRALAALLVVVFAFFFVTVSSRIVGLVGVTSNPTSGMTIATLLGTSSLFFVLGWTDDAGKVAALTIGAVVAIAASIAGDTSQDLKTGFLLGSDSAAAAGGRAHRRVDVGGIRGPDGAAPGAGVRLRRQRAPCASGDADEARHRRRARAVPPLEPGRHRCRNRGHRRARSDPFPAVRRRCVPAGLDYGPGVSRRAPPNGRGASGRDGSRARRPAKPRGLVRVGSRRWRGAHRGRHRRSRRVCRLSGPGAVASGLRVGRRGGGVVRTRPTRGAGRVLLASCHLPGQPGADALAARGESRV